MIKELIDFIAASPTAFHAADNAQKKCIASGFEPIGFNDLSSLSAGKYCLLAGESTFIAFILPPGVKPSGFQIIASHTDSPHLRLRTKGYHGQAPFGLLSVETYGGLIYHTWLDRDLSIAGRLFVKTGKRKISSHLFHLKEPLVSLPSLAIHLNRNVNESLSLNPESQLNPIFYSKRGDFNDYLSETTGIPQKDILSYDLCLYDTQAPAISGPSQELLHSARLDNLAMVHASLTALTQTLPEKGIVPLIALFDNEEVGSLSEVGAASNLLPKLLESLVFSFGKEKSFLDLMNQSIILSADMAHAEHPHHLDKHPQTSRPRLNQGPVLKINESKRYGTNGKTEAYLRYLCRQHDLPLQTYHHRYDLPCGSTVGPILAGKLNIITADLGNPLWGMHSIRETSGVKDHNNMVNLMKAFLKEKIF